MVPIVLYSNSIAKYCNTLVLKNFKEKFPSFAIRIAILSKYCKNYCQKYCKISKYCKKYCHILRSGIY